MYLPSIEFGIFFLFKYFMDILKLINIKADELFSATVKSPTLSSKAPLKWATNRYKYFLCLTLAHYGFILP